MKKAIIGLLFISPIASASQVDSAQIKELLAGPVYGNIVFLKVEPKPSTVPACQTNANYSYAFDAATEAGKASLSMALTAYSTARSVYLSGYDACSNNTAGVENLQQILIK